MRPSFAGTPITIIIGTKIVSTVGFLENLLISEMRFLIILDEVKNVGIILFSFINIEGCIAPTNTGSQTKTCLEKITRIFLAGAAVTQSRF